MSKKLLLLTLSFLLLCFSSILAQEDEEQFEEVFYNPYFQSGSSGFELDGQVIEGSDWEWLHPTPNGSTLNWVQVIDANTWLMAGFGGTFMKTTDAGATFTVYKTVGNLSASGIYRTIYDGHFFDANTGLICGSSGTLLRTTDGGATWDSVGVGSSSTIYSMCFLDANVGFIIGTTTIDVWKTTDAGLTWTKLSGGILGTAYEIFATDEDTLFYGSTSGDLGRSNDGGATWIEVDIGISETIREIEFSTPTDGWAVGDDGAASYTTDAGLTWTLANTGLPITSDFNDVEIMSTMSQTLNEGFEDVTFPPTGWHAKNILGPIEWFRATGTAHTGDASARVSWDGSGGEDWLVTPQVPIVTGDSLKFWARKIFSTVYEPDTIEIRISMTDTSVASFTDVIYKNSVNVAFNTVFEQFAFDLSAYNGMNVYIAFRHYDVDGNGMYLDDVTVGEPMVSEVALITGDPFDIYFTTDMGTTWTPYFILDPTQLWTGEFFTTSFYGGGIEAITVGTRGMINGWSTPFSNAGGNIAYNTWLKSGTLYDISVQSTERVVVGGQPGISGSTFDQVVYSTDFGETWGIATFSDSMTQDVNDMNFFGSIFTGYLCGDEGRIYKTTDGGETWTFVSEPTTLELEVIYFFDENNGFTFGDDGAAFKTTDGGATWATLTTGFGTADIWTASFLDISNFYIAGSSGTLEYTTDGGTTFTPLNPDFGTSTIYKIEMLDANDGYLCGSSGKVRKTTDGGTTWTTIDPGLSTGSIYDLDFYDSIYGVLTQSSGRTYYTNDGGTTWFFENTGASSLYAVDIYDTSPDTAAVFVCGSLAFIQRNMDVIVPVELSSFTASVAENNVTLEWMTATELNNLGFYVERQESEQWSEVGFIEGSGTTTETQEYRFVDRNVPAGTYYYRIKQVDFDGTAKYYEHQQEVEVGAPASYELSQNYPNPFNPTTKIKYSVPADGFVNIAVYNILGEKVVDIVNSIQKAGRYEVNFDATNIASGMYLYRMESGDFVSIKKMMILK
ncbi:MAG: choice-of-anchor J domain-containing protein [Ignavibacteria bacterium]|nr:choice-of-anchor J domain-containing protein [Ignavibacteria bacterium]